MTARRAAFATVGLLVSGTAAAHTGIGSGNGLDSGLLHPIVGWDHLLAAVAVGLWAARHHGGTAFLLPLAFLTAMTAGMALGLGGITLPGVEPAILTSLVIFGGVLALKRRASARLATGILAAFAIFHGYAHGTETTAPAAVTAYGFGLLFTTAALHGIGILAGRLLNPLAIRLAGTAIGTAGVWMLAAG